MGVKTLNKVLLLGNVGADPELRYTNSGTAVASFSVATKDSWTDANGQAQERTEWHKCVAWDKLAEIAGEYLAKGRQVYIEGKNQTRSWEDQSGGKRYTTEVVVRDLILLGGRSDHAAE